MLEQNLFGHMLKVYGGDASATSPNLGEASAASQKLWQFRLTDADQYQLFHEERARLKEL